MSTQPGRLAAQPHRADADGEQRDGSSDGPGQAAQPPGRPAVEGDDEERPRDDRGEHEPGEEQQPDEHPGGDPP